MNINKQLIYNACLENRKSIAENAKSAMDDIQQQANEYGPPKDRYDSFRAQLLRKRDLFAEQYQNALNDIDVLKKIKPESVSLKVEFGSLFRTGKQWMFIAIGIGKITIDKIDIFVISPAVPVFKAMDGKKAGEYYIFNGKQFGIDEIL
ncbi:MAG: hypothetical protein A2W91_03415 [Bacteroidetes bacterium GWF2_38_335]|nr:MAG: hypothetical protein A2W91_03415 [Bacteroidetes bacterium GWF2_38_335]HBS87243.1 hypothetical protein [Bacteroidales bacterium]